MLVLALLARARPRRKPEIPDEALRSAERSMQDAVWKLFDSNDFRHFPKNELRDGMRLRIIPKPMMVYADDLLSRAQYGHPTSLDCLAMKSNKMILNNWFHEHLVDNPELAEKLFDKTHKELVRHLAPIEEIWATHRSSSPSTTRSR